MSMKKLLDEMVSPISNEYVKFDSYFTESMLTDVKLINSVVRYVAKRKGRDLGLDYVFVCKVMRRN